MQECEEASVFIELFESTAKSPYSKAKRLKALVRNGFDRHEKIDSGLSLLEWVVENMADDNQESLEILDALIPGSDVNAPYAEES